MISPADELRAAAQVIRDQANRVIGHRIDGDDGQVVRFVGIEHATALLVAKVLEAEADEYAGLDPQFQTFVADAGEPCPVVALARAINGSTP